MAKTETNDAKRAEMKALCAAAIAAGWTQQTLAAYFGCSSFSPFVNGKSMGTNDLRADIKALPTFTKELALAKAAKLQAEAADLRVRGPRTLPAHIIEAWGPECVARVNEQDLANNQKRANEREKRAQVLTKAAVK